MLQKILVLRDGITHKLGYESYVVNNAVVETFVSAQTGTWTITVNTPNGTTCLVASGQSYQAVNDPLPPPGEDS